LRKRPFVFGAAWAVAVALAVGLTHFYVRPAVQSRLAGDEKHAGAREALAANPAYAALRAHEPALFAQLSTDYAAAAGDPARLAVFSRSAHATISRVATQRIAQASQDALLALMRDMLANLKLLRASSGADCHAYLFPESSGPPDMSRHVDAQAQQRTLELMADVIRTAATDPAPPPDRARVERALGPVVDAVYAQFGSDAQVLSHAEDPAVDRAKVCAVAVSLYERVLSLPPDDAAAVIRSMTQL
jgi:hypothetical protein